MESCPTYEYSLPITPTIQEVIDLVQHFVPHEPSANCSFKQFTDGLTNRLFKIAYDDGTERNQILIRIYGEKTELLIDREKELKSMIELEKYGFAPKVYGKFVNGVCYGYFSGKPFTNLDIIDTAKSALVAAHLARFHTVTIPGIPTNPSLFDTLHKWQNEVKNLNSEQFSQEEFENNGFYNENGFSNELTFLKDKMKEFNKDWEVVFCHNDLLSGNIIFKEDSVQFIDYEYGSYNYLLFDVANHLCESMGVDVDLSLFPSDDFIKRWLRIYLATRENVAELDLPAEKVEDFFEQVKVMLLAANLYWGIWSLVQNSLSTNDFDYLNYSRKRLSTHFILKNRYFSNQ